MVNPILRERSCIASKLYFGLPGSMKVTIRCDCSDSGTGTTSPSSRAHSTRILQQAVYLAYLPSMVSSLVSIIACLRA
jgi:hypothetical protein